MDWVCLQKLYQAVLAESNKLNPDCADVYSSPNSDMSTMQINAQKYWVRRILKRVYHQKNIILALLHDAQVESPVLSPVFTFGSHNDLCMSGYYRPPLSKPWWY